MQSRVTAAAALGMFASAAFGISGLEFDDFEGGTTQGWSHGAPSPVPPTVETEDSNSFLRIESLGGGGPGSRLAAFNRDQWLGDYVSAGVTAITLDVRNSGNTDLFVRFGVRGLGGITAATTDSIVLAAGSGWQTATIDLTDLSGGALYSDLFTDVSELRIVSSEVADFLGDPIVATLDVDNIRAVPAPGAAALLGLGGVFGTRRRR